MASDKIKQLCEYIDNNKVKNYPINNEILKNSTDYVKNSYMKMLAVILQTGDDVEKSQKDLFTRIVVGGNVEYDVEDYLRQAIDIEIQEYLDFVKDVKDTELKYRFVLDAIILSTVSSINEEKAKMIANFMEDLKLEKIEVEFISKLAKSILLQDSTLYQKLRKSTEDIGYSIYQDYIVLFVNGVCFSSQEMLHIQYLSKEKLDMSIFEAKDAAYVLKNNKILIKHAEINLSEKALHLDSNEEVIFEKCKIVGDKCSIYLSGCEKVVFKGCTFVNFKETAINEKSVGSIVFRDCKFIDCYKYYRRGRDDWKELGGVIYTEDAEKNAVNVITECEFKNCGGVNESNYYSSAVLSNCRINISNTKIRNCWNYNNAKEIDKSKLDPESPFRSLFIKGTISEKIDIHDSALLVPNEKEIFY